jgi:hypothetical protein
MKPASRRGDGHMIRPHPLPRVYSPDFVGALNTA